MLALAVRAERRETRRVGEAEEQTDRESDLVKGKDRQMRRVKDRE